MHYERFYGYKKPAMKDQFKTLLTITGIIIVLFVIVLTVNL